MSNVRCTHCGQALETGFVMDSGQSSQGCVTWVQGPLERGVFSGATHFGRTKWPVEAFRCRRRRHLELFAGLPG
ncbi:hypothetical protein FE391_11355 [Nonomuraea sp. KC401]|uniref:hypothetical protein n=1 Tax=unclassified Nonomuraea TaxID=2593643 RepID=UPI0010FE2D44|nr:MULTISPECIES: hypothetical protein [unclassified Nonomuraea]NBE94395.1 hypothetical protein [Nonomuraea sp. K271]TLF77057.1 hypothetical protein FE391_11355 [Nonomuraea sp. KC401]